jgi:ribosome maturation factor RimP
VGRCPLFVFGGDFTQLTDRIRAIAERVAGSYGLDIFDVQFRREPQGWMLRIFVDVPDTDQAPADRWVSVSIQDCERVSRDVSAILDVEDAIDHQYTLEVSSPGLDRPLRGAGDYRRFAGRLAKIVVSEAIDNQKHFAGRLHGLEQDAVIIETAPGRRHLIPLPLITRARLDVEF